MTDETQTPPEDERSSDKAHANVGIVTALPMELNPFLGLCERRRSYTGKKFKFVGGVYKDKVKVVVVQKAVGFAKARAATQALIDAHTPNWVISAGFSGALKPDMQVGNIVVGSSIADQHGHSMKIDLQMSSDPENGLHVGRLLTADQIILSVEDKQKAGEQFDALAADLESLAVAQVCKERGVRFMAIRALSDDMTEDLPKEVLSLMGETGTVRLGAAVGAVWKRFGSVKDMWHLREKATLASRRLGVFLGQLLPRLVE
jgi:adenosylhomocysteine nucleosidase